MCNSVTKGRAMVQQVDAQKVGDASGVAAADMNKPFFGVQGTALRGRTRHEIGLDRGLRDVGDELDGGGLWCGRSDGKTGEAEQANEEIMDSHDHYCGDFNGSVAYCGRTNHLRCPISRWTDRNSGGLSWL